MSTNKRDHLFPSMSLGRSSSSQVPRIGSTESLTAHPLLSPTPTAATFSSSATAIPTSGSNSSLNSMTNNTSAGAARDESSTPKYVPYTPRQRAGPTTAASTTMGTMQQNPQQNQQYPHGGDAASRLQLMALKAATQNIGLDPGMLGWAMLERLVSEGAGGGAAAAATAGSSGANARQEWNEIWSAISTGKATLLLPLDHQAHGHHELITPEFVKDHVVLYDASSTEIVTLSGLRGTLDEQQHQLTFRSSLSPSTKAFQALLSPTTRASTLSTLPPLPLLPTPSTYPSYTLPSHTASLPLPPRLSSTSSAGVGSPSKPPLPPRPGTRPSAPTASSTASRFASLFGRAPASATLSTPSSTSASLPPVSSQQQTTSQQLQQPAHTDTTADQAGITVGAFAISRRIARKDLGKALIKSLRGEVKDALRGASCPAWVVERTQAFTEGLYPLVKPPKVIAAAMAASSATSSYARRRMNNSADDRAGSSASAAGHDGNEPEYVVAPPEAEPALVSERFREFYALLEDDLRSGNGARPILGGRRKNRGRVKDATAAGGNYYDEDETTMPMMTEKKGESEARIVKILEVVERTVCSLFYDRLFIMSSSDDASHDEALTSRIAALHMLDLNLGHLDVDVGEASADVDVIVRACGDTLTQLEACRSPTDKSAVLVAAHKVIVDGLGKLPPVKLRAPGEGRDKVDTRPPLPKRRGPPPAKEEEEEVMVASPVDMSEEKMALLDSGGETPAPGGDVKGGAENAEEDEEENGDDDGEEEESDEEEEEEEEEEKEPDGSDHPPLSSPQKETNDAANIVGGQEQKAATAITSASPIGEPPRSSSGPPPLLTISPAATETPTPVSGDVLFPLLIFSAVKANPPHLVSHLLFTERFRNQAVGGGEREYCLVNLLAVVGFLENVDLQALGLTTSTANEQEDGEAGGKKMISTAELTPIPISPVPAVHQQPAATVAAQQQQQKQGSGMLLSGATLRGRMEQQVDAIAGSANKVISGVVDSSFGVLRSLLPGQQQQQQQSAAGSVAGATLGSAVAEDEDAADSLWNGIRPGARRRESGFSIAGIAASLPVRSLSRHSMRDGDDDDEGGQQMIDVPSRPGSVRSVYAGSSSDEDEDEDEDEDDEDEDDQSRMNSSEEGEEDEDGRGEEDDDHYVGSFHDTRSIRSFESMMSSAKEGGGKRKERKSLSDRLATVSGLTTKLVHPTDLFKDSPSPRRPPLLTPVAVNNNVNSNRFDSPVSSRPSSPVSISITAPPGAPIHSGVTGLGLMAPPPPLPPKVAPPVARFMECREDDLRVSEVAELLRDYRRLANAMKALNLFE